MAILNDPNRPRIRIPPERANEFDVVVDVQLMQTGSFDGARAYTRLRFPVGRLYEPGERVEVMRQVHGAVENILEATMTLPPKKAKAGDG